ncbi:transposase [Streptomyces sp. NPDC005385]|uniref:transposase n=1 Tax=Streptomyces sp. NPDC005385 TaxID=3157039 RepID=UPI0033A66BC9
MCRTPNRHYVRALHTHAVLVTKYRHKAFVDGHLTRVKDVMRTVCEDCEVELTKSGSENNDVHLLVGPRRKSSCPSLSTASRASTPADGDRSSPASPRTTSGPTNCGPLFRQLRRWSASVD